MKNIRYYFSLAALLPVMLGGCASNPGGEPKPVKSDKCDLLTFAIDGQNNGLERSIEFAIDQEARTVKGVYTTETMPDQPEKMIPTFTIDGERARIDGVIVESGRPKLSFAEDFYFVVLAENGDTRTYRVSLEWNYEKGNTETGDLLTFSLNGERNGLESSVDFTIDKDALTVKGVYTTATMIRPPAAMAPTFRIDGVEARIGDETIESEVSEISFDDEFDFVVETSGGDEKTYKVSLDWQYTGSLSGDCNLETFRLAAANNPGLKSNVGFTLDGNTLTFSARYLSWITGDEPWMLVPEFTTTGEKVLVEGREVTSGVTPISFAEDISMTVVAENGTEKVYTVSIVCPQINSELPVLHLSDITASQITSKDMYIKSNLEMYSLTSSMGRWSPSDGKVEIRGRGNSTWGLPKKPYRLKFPEDFSPVGLNHTEAKSWTLLAHDMDKSLLRGHLGYGIAAIMFDDSEGYHDPSAIMWSPASQHVNIYFKGEYHGLYQMSDQVERDNGRLAVDKLTAADGTTKTGGYMIESSIHGDNTPRFNTRRKGYQFLMKYPEQDDYVEAQRSWISNFVGNAEDALYGTNFKDKTNGWRKWFDEKTMADFIIVKEIVGDMDGYTSTQCYKRDGVEKLFFGPVWDTDKGWGNEKRVPISSYPPSTSLMIKAGFHMGANYNALDDWFNRVWEDADFRRLVAQRWAEKKDEIVAFILQELDEKPAAMAKSIEANFIVWPYYFQANSGEAPLPAATYELEIERMRDWTINRVAILDREFAK